MAKNVALPDDVHADLKKAADEHGMKMTSIVERCVRDWLIFINSRRNKYKKSNVDKQ